LERNEGIREIIIFWEMTPVALIRTDVSEDRIASIFRVHEYEQVTERSSKLLYRHRLIGDDTVSSPRR
jgi:hypothetical protein